MTYGSDSPISGPAAQDMRKWWKWYARVATAIRTRDAIVQRVRHALTSAHVSDQDEDQAVMQIVRQVDTLEKDAIAGERLLLLGARPERAIRNIVRRLDATAAELCDLLVASRRR